ncbi:hypothetical protein [Streptomyces luteogriseus]|uniref:hypothetical protein n=1 Tax=Streptomyces luteogriseus TaxID=68233 RepID=UPI00262DAF68|nr:hypothetical protein [uncultured Streptomyces sp.]
MSPFVHVPHRGSPETWRRSGSGPAPTPATRSWAVSVSTPDETVRAGAWESGRWDVKETIRTVYSIGM